MTHTNELKPCPFCGSNDTWTDSALGKRQVLCNSCEASGPTEETDDEAIDSWNRRASLPSDAAQAPLAGIPLLAEDHKGMRVDYSGMLGQAQEALTRGVRSGAIAEMLRQFKDHITELGTRWYAGDTAVVDELLQLYCIQKGARAALVAAAPVAPAAAAPTGDREFHEAAVQLVRDMLDAAPSFSAPSGLLARINALLTAPVPSADTAHLLASPANAVRLKRSIDEFKGAQQGERAPWPTLAPLHLEAIAFAYNEGWQKAYDGREFTNPFADIGSQAAAWKLGTRDGNERRTVHADSQKAPEIHGATAALRHLLDSSNSYGSLIEFSYSPEWQAASSLLATGEQPT